MSSRKAISKKVRFEIFKRDAFTCQYCGKSAPDVILQVDHIEPVSKGGTNETLNLITSCFDCNSGKKATPLSRKEEVKKQRRQLENLNEQRKQLDMLFEWKKELIQFNIKLCREAVDYWNSKTKYLFPDDILSKAGEAKIERLISRFGFEEVIEAIGISVDRYLTRASDYHYKIAFEKIGGICYNRKKRREEDDK